MITLLHGDNVLASRGELTKIRQNFSGEVMVLDGQTLDETAFIQATQAQSMFAAEKLVIVENFFSRKKKLALNLGEVTCRLVFWEDKKIGEVENIKDAREFKTPPSIFKFLNNLTVPALRRALKDNDVQFVFAMMIWHFRRTGNKENLKKMLELDYAFKQGLLPCDLATHLELFLLL